MTPPVVSDFAASGCRHLNVDGSVLSTLCPFQFESALKHKPAYDITGATNYVKGDFKAKPLLAMKEEGSRSHNSFATFTSTQYGHQYLTNTSCYTHIHK